MGSIFNQNSFIALNAEVGKQDLNKLVTFQTNLNSLKTKVGDLDVGKLKTVPEEII